MVRPFSLLLSSTFSFSTSQALCAGFALLHLGTDNAPSPLESSLTLQLQYDDETPTADELANLTSSCSDIVKYGMLLFDFVSRCAASFDKRPGY
jgi:hypothetical protein